MLKKSTISLRLRGLNLERVINKSTASGVFFLLLKRFSQFEIYCKIYLKDYDKLLILLNENNIEIIEKKEKGLLASINFLKRHVGMLVGFILCTILSLFLFNKIWRIDICCDEQINRQEIVELLEQSGVEIGESFFEINTQEIEKFILLNCKECSLASVARKGTSLIINLKKRNDSQIKFDNFESVLAPCSGVVEKVELIQGTLNVSVGDIVKKGEVLVFPFIISANKNLPVEAKAKIILRSWCEGSVEFDENGQRLVKSGNVETKRYIEVFGKKIGKKNSDINFDAYEVDKSSKNICKNMLIPFKIIVERYSELIYKQETRKFEEVQDILSKKSCDLAREKLLDGMQVESENTSQVKVGSRYIITTIIECTVCVE